ncbi:ferredoxin family protein [Desulfovibrio sp. OttesenSCG-928-C14]|nr:ferredoxin family protein [Desulfovibrio sp. OttesenSCG-928-C14]
MPPIIDPEKCNGCGTCARICPTQVFRYDRTKDQTPSAVFAEECWHCNSCVLDCPAQAVSLRLPAPLMMLHIGANRLKP